MWKSNLYFLTLLFVCLSVSAALKGDDNEGILGAVGLVFCIGFLAVCEVIEKKK